MINETNTYSIRAWMPLVEDGHPKLKRQLFIVTAKSQCEALVVFGKDHSDYDGAVAVKELKTQLFGEI